jgi:hypothetical protein
MEDSRLDLLTCSSNDTALLTEIRATSKNKKRVVFLVSSSRWPEGTASIPLVAG